MNDLTRYYAIDRDSIRDYNAHISECIAVYYANENGYVAEYGGLKPELLPNNRQFKLNSAQIKLVEHTLHLEGRSDKVQFIGVDEYESALEGGSIHAKATK